MANPKKVIPVTFLPGFPDQVIRERLYDERNYRTWDGEESPGDKLSIVKFSTWSVTRIYWNHRLSTVYLPKIALHLRDLGYGKSRFVLEVEKVQRIANTYKITTLEAINVIRIARAEKWLKPLKLNKRKKTKSPEVKTEA